MKRIFILVMAVFMLSSITAFAGDIPESYLSDDVQMFFCEVVYYHPDKEVPSIQVSPVKKIKGDVKEGTLQSYTNPNVYGGIKLKQDEIYLFAFYDDTNGLDVFEVTTYNTKTLKLKNVSGDMWERMEKYLNDGEYGVAEIEDRKSPEEKRKTNSTTIAVIVALAVVFTGGTLAIKKKHTKE